LYIIRNATPEDAQAIARVHVDSWRTTYTGIVPDEHLANLSVERSQARWQEHIITHPEQRAFVVEFPPDQIVGMASCGPIREPVGEMDGELYGLYLLKAFQGKGLGRALVLQVVQHLADQGFQSLALWCLKENPSCGFYLRMGGQPTCEKTIEIGGKQLLEVAFTWPDLRTLLAEFGTGDVPR
jgi:GNAT superfamily N-acetyltransferase